MAATKLIASMAISTVVIMLLSSAMAAHASSSREKGNANLVVDACKNISREPFKVGFLPEFCATTLQSDKRSAEAKDCRDLALITVDILKVHATSMVGWVDKLLRKGGEIDVEDKIAARALRFCRVDYAGMVSTLQICHDIFNDFGHKGEGAPRPSELPECVEKASNTVKHCLHEVDNTSVASTVAMSSEKLQKLSLIGKALINLFLVSKKDDY